MAFLDCFEEDKISVTPYTVIQAPNSSGQWVDTETAKDPIKGLWWSTSIASRYFNTSWNVETVAVFATDQVSDLVLDGRIDKDSDKYAIDSIDNVGEQGEVYLIGLRFQK